MRVSQPTVESFASLPISDAKTARTMFATGQALAKQQDMALRSPPPEPTTCCGRGCNGCVWEGFLFAATDWRDEAVLILQATQSS